MSDRNKIVALRRPAPTVVDGDQITIDRAVLAGIVAPSHSERHLDQRERDLAARETRLRRVAASFLRGRAAGADLDENVSALHL
jgi:hypothetical protein